jgi:hypothetical protein
MFRRPVRLLDEVVEVAAGCRAGLVGVVGDGEADREEGGRGQAKGGVMLLGPLDERTLVVAGVDRGAEDDGVVVRRRGLRLVRMKLVQVDARAVELEHRGDPRGDLGGVAVGAGVEHEDAWHVTKPAGPGARAQPGDPAADRGVLRTVSRVIADAPVTCRA